MELLKNLILRGTGGFSSSPEPCPWVGAKPGAPGRLRASAWKAGSSGDGEYGLNASLSNPVSSADETTVASVTIYLTEQITTYLGLACQALAQDGELLTCAYSH